MGTGRTGFYDCPGLDRPGKMRYNHAITPKEDTTPREYHHSDPLKARTNSQDLCI